jgi:hypothetical protein
MHKPWLVQYPAGIPAEIDIHQFASLKDVLAASCTRFADLPAYVWMKRESERGYPFKGMYPTRI